MKTQRLRSILTAAISGVLLLAANTHASIKWTQIGPANTHAGKWTYSDPDGTISHDSIPWILNVTANGTELTIESVATPYPDTPTILPLGDLVDGGFSITAIANATSHASGVFFGRLNAVSGPGAYIQSLTLPPTLRTIGDYAFSYCSVLRGALTIPDSVANIGNSAFEGCYEITNLTLGADLTDIGDLAFSNLGMTGSVALPDGLAYISGSAFTRCCGLTDITIGHANTVYSSNDGILFSKDGSRLVCVPSGRSGLFTVPAGTTDIDYCAFAYCYGVTGVIIPDSVTNIGRAVFSSCSGLTGVTIPASVASIGNYAFENCLGLNHILFEGIQPAMGTNVFWEAQPVPLYVRPTHIAGWTPDSGSFNTSDAVWQGNPIAVLEEDAPVLATMVALEETGLGGEIGTGLYYYVTVPVGTTRLWITLSGGAGNCNLYAQHSAGVDSDYSTFGGNYEQIVVRSPAAGIWYIMLHGALAYSDVTLTVSYDEPPACGYLTGPVFGAGIAPSLTTAYAGFAYDDDGTVLGTLTLSAKMTFKKGVESWAFTAKAVLQNATVSFSGKAWDGVAGKLTLTARTGETLSANIGTGAFYGTLSGGKVGAVPRRIVGARDAFADKKDTTGAALRLNDVRGYYTAALIGAAGTDDVAGYLTFTVGNNGSVKFAGKLADGTAVSGSAKLLEGLNDDGWLCVALHKPLYTKKGCIGGLVWLDPADRVLRTDTAYGWFIDWTCNDAIKSPSKAAFARELDLCGGYFGTGKEGIKLETNYLFSAFVPADLPPVDATYTNAFWADAAYPIGLTVTSDLAKNKLTLTRGKAPIKPKNGELQVYDYSGTNAALVTIGYTAKTGIFKGNFKLYFDGMKNGRLQHKAASVSYTGVLIPVRDPAYDAWPIGFGAGPVKVGKAKFGVGVTLD